MFELAIFIPCRDIREKLGTIVFKFGMLGQYARIDFVSRCSILLNMWVFGIDFKHVNICK